MKVWINKFENDFIVFTKHKKDNSIKRIDLKNLKKNKMALLMTAESTYFGLDLSYKLITKKGIYRIRKLDGSYGEIDVAMLKACKKDFIKSINNKSKDFKKESFIRPYKFVKFTHDNDDILYKETIEEDKKSYFKNPQE